VKAKTFEELKIENEELKAQLEQYKSVCAKQETLINIESLSVGMFHEIHNPLTILKSNLESLKDEVVSSGKMDEKRELLFKMAERGIDRMDQVASSLKRVIQGVNQQSDLSEKKVVDLKFLIKDTMNFVSPSFRKSGIILSQNLKDSCYVNAHPARLQQVFLNLLLNAKDAVSKSDIKEIEFEVVSDAKQAIILVKDTGHGIKPEDRAKVFQSFYTSKELGKGSGLGLSLSKQYIEDMNGFIDVESEPGQGACFIIRLDLVDSSELPKEDHSKKVVSKLTSGKLLIVHPKSEVAAVLQNSLSKQGFDVSISQNAMDARELVKKSDFDFVLVSYQLDSMNGLQFVSSLKNEVSSYLILLFDKSLSSLPEKTKESILSIAHGYLERPYDDRKFGELMAKIKSIDSMSA
tara:strand:+ start:4126 stop:5343 length:1218 start_codon:yes stop_codon:yes gene_type:complete